MKICAFGDSILKGVVLENNGVYKIEKDNFSVICEKELGVTIENFGKFGSTITTGEKIFEKNIEKLKESQYVVFEFGGNDCDFNWREVSQNPNVNHLPKSNIEEFKNKYIELISKVRQFSAKPIILTLPPIDAKKYFKQITKGLNADNILKFLKGSQDSITYWHEMYNSAVCEIAKSMNVPLIDITSAFRENNNYSSLLCEDGIHPNKAGHKIIAKAIERYAFKEI